MRLSFKAKFLTALWVAAALALAFNGWFFVLLMFVSVTACYAMMAAVLTVLPT